jgi:hypothetical protein
VPKQRSKPHQHGRANRTGRSGRLLLPEFSTDAFGPTYRFPPGWLQRPVGEKVGRMYGYFALVAIAVLVLLLGCAGFVTLVQWLLEPH